MFARSISIHLKPNSVADFTQTDRKGNPSDASEAKGLPGRSDVRRPGGHGSLSESVCGIRKRTPTLIAAMRIQEC